MKAMLMASAGLVAISTVPMVAAADPIEDAIKARQASMRLNAFTLGMRGAMAKGERSYDPELASALANDLQALASLSNAEMWPEGSSNEALGLADKTRALPAIWTTFPEVVEKHDVWEEATVQLSAVAGDGLEALQANIGPVGQGCGGCHETFRAEAK
jgi:cytochrome c556